MRRVQCPECGFVHGDDYNFRGEPEVTCEQCGHTWFRFDRLDKDALLARAREIIEYCGTWESMTSGMTNWVADYCEAAGLPPPEVLHNRPALPLLPAYSLFADTAMRAAAEHFMGYPGTGPILQDIENYIRNWLSQRSRARRFEPWKVKAASNFGDLLIEVSPAPGTWEREYAARLGPNVTIAQARYWAKKVEEYRLSRRNT